jgi:hypothetical protein
MLNLRENAVRRSPAGLFERVAQEFQTLCTRSKPFREEVLPVMMRDVSERHGEAVVGFSVNSSRGQRIEKAHQFIAGLRLLGRSRKLRWNELRGKEAPLAIVPPIGKRGFRQTAW